MFFMGEKAQSLSNAFQMRNQQKPNVTKGFLTEYHRVISSSNEVLGPCGPLGESCDIVKERDRKGSEVVDRERERQKGEEKSR